MNLAFVRSHLQSQAMLTFVTAFEWTTLTAPKSMHILENSQLVFGRGSSQVEACIASPTSCPYVNKQLMGSSTYNHCSAPLYSYGVLAALCFKDSSVLLVT